MAQNDMQLGGLVISENTGTTSTNVTLIAAPAATKAHRIKWITCYGTTATAADVKVTQGDGTTVMARVGGTGTTILSQPIVFGAAGADAANNTGLVCKKNDLTIVTLSVAGGGACDLAVCYDFVNGA